MNQGCLNFWIKKIRITFIALALLITARVDAAKFANQFVEFELPQDWVCLLEGAEWICQNQKDMVKRKEAIIVLAAKIQGDQDTLDQYSKYLQNPKNYTTPQGKTVTSQSKYTQTKNIQGQPWVDSLHLESEIPGFYTRYLATVKDGIGILVTYSVSRNKYEDYKTIFENLVSSLKAFRREGGLNAASASSDLFKNTKIPTGMTTDTVFGKVQGSEDEKPTIVAADQGWKKLLDDPIVFYGGAAALGLILITILKKLKGK